MLRQRADYSGRLERPGLDAERAVVLALAKCAVAVLAELIELGDRSFDRAPVAGCDAALHRSGVVERVAGPLPRRALAQTIPDRFGLRERRLELRQALCDDIRFRFVGRRSQRGKRGVDSL